MVPWLTDSVLAFRAITTAATVYLALTLVCPSGSRVPLLTGAFIFATVISRTPTFQGMAARAISLSSACIERSLGLLEARLAPEGDASSQFHALGKVSRSELLEALISLKDYAVNSGKSNDRRRRLFKMMSWRQQKLCDEAGYLAKLKLIDTHVDKNQRMFNAISESVESAYGINYKHYDWLKATKSCSQSTSSTNYRVIETLGHFVRDWAPAREQEIAPMLYYIKTQLDKVVVPENAARTCIVVPGSGLGRVAHEVAFHRNYGAVHAVEFSGLMHACNRFVYEPSQTSERKFYPYVHNTSNYLTIASQFRETTMPAGLKQPQNLHLHLDDFRYFAVPEKEKYDTVVVVSVFFIDTAENIMDYFDQINQLTAPSKASSLKNGYWINFGPLKYGSAAQAELNAAEIAYIRKGLGWNDVHSLNTIEDPEADFSRSEIQGSGLSAYSTDTESLWQGYYGISMWTSEQKSNAAQVLKQV